MTLHELIDRECNRVLDEICARRYLRKSDVVSRRIRPHLVNARVEVIRTLTRNGFRQTDIARALNCNHATVKYWVDDETRDRRRTQCEAYASQRRGNVRDHLRNHQAPATPSKASQDRSFTGIGETGKAEVAEICGIIGGIAG